MDYKILESEFCVCQLPPQAAIPPPTGGFFSVTRTTEELSVVCENPPTDSVKVDAGWTVLQVVGPLDFALTGILASFAAPLAGAGISIFSIATFDTDYILVKTANLPRAVEALAAAGHRRVDTVPK
ncbi:MAG: ACT domain-containing protein [Bryobacteraceae bacterium]